MPRDGALIFKDIAGNLDLLWIECAKCGRAGRYRVGRLIAARGANASVIEWRLELTRNVSFWGKADVVRECSYVAF